jgi:hypothetical protein
LALSFHFLADKHKISFILFYFIVYWNFINMWLALNNIRKVIKHKNDQCFDFNVAINRLANGNGNTRVFVFCVRVSECLPVYRATPQ